MIIALLGPTGSGKSDLSIKLAKRYNGIIINCDSMQIYQGCDIGTAKVTKEEQEGIPHYLLDVCDIKRNYTVYDYQKDARRIIEENQDKNIIIVGGTGLYLKALLYDYRFVDEEEHDTDYSLYSNEELYQMCLEKDPNMDIHINNRKRLERFLDKELSEKVEPVLLYDNVKFIGLTMDRDKLYERLDKRVDIMIKNGLIEEAKHFYDLKVKSKALDTIIGYKELFLYFKGELTLEESIDLIKKNTRHYAKRQYTFFNNQLDLKWFDVLSDNYYDKVINYIDN